MLRRCLSCCLGCPGPAAWGALALPGLPWPCLECPGPAGVALALLGLPRPCLGWPGPAWGALALLGVPWPCRFCWSAAVAADAARFATANFCISFLNLLRCWAVLLPGLEAAHLCSEPRPSRDPSKSCPGCTYFSRHLYLVWAQGSPSNSTAQHLSRTRKGKG